MYKSNYGSWLLIMIVSLVLGWVVEEVRVSNFIGFFLVCWVWGWVVCMILGNVICVLWLCVVIFLVLVFNSNYMLLCGG